MSLTLRGAWDSSSLVRSVLYCETRISISSEGSWTSVVLWRSVVNSWCLILDMLLYLMVVITEPGFLRHTLNRTNSWSEMHGSCMRMLSIKASSDLVMTRSKVWPDLWVPWLTCWERLKDSKRPKLCVLWWMETNPICQVWLCPFLAWFSFQQNRLVIFTEHEVLLMPIINIFFVFWYDHSFCWNLASNSQPLISLILFTKYLFICFISSSGVAEIDWLIHSFMHPFIRIWVKRTESLVIL